MKIRVFDYDCPHCGSTNDFDFDNKEIDVIVYSVEQNILSPFAEVSVFVACPICKKSFEILLDK